MPQSKAGLTIRTIGIIALAGPLLTFIGYWIMLGAYWIFRLLLGHTYAGYFAVFLIAVTFVGLLGPVVLRSYNWGNDSNRGPAEFLRAVAAALLLYSHWLPSGTLRWMIFLAASLLMSASLITEHVWRLKTRTTIEGSESGHQTHNSG